MMKIEECTRCENPQYPIVILEKSIPICNACIIDIAKKADVRSLIGNDHTPETERGYINWREA